MRYWPIKLSRLDWRDREFIYGASRISLGQEAVGEEARQYLYGQRGLDIETVARFRLGYVPFQVGNGPARQFAGRIVFPIFDPYDNLIALSVRPVRDGVVTEQKYWNESFSKGENLYGLNVAKYQIATWDFAVVVEGQFDVLKMHSHGLTNTVGILGGAFTPIHANILKRWTNNLVFVMDGDTAGSNHAEAAEKVMAIYGELQSGKSLLRTSRLQGAFVVLEQGADPASFLAQRGGRVMRKLINDALSDKNMRVSRKWAA